MPDLRGRIIKKFILSGRYIIIILASVSSIYRLWLINFNHACTEMSNCIVRISTHLRSAKGVLLSYSGTHRPLLSGLYRRLQNNFFAFLFLHNHSPVIYPTWFCITDRELFSINVGHELGKQDNGGARRSPRRSNLKLITS